MRQSIWVSILLPFFGLNACSGKTSDSGDDDEYTGDLWLTNASTYTYDGSLIVDSNPLAEGADSTVSWDGMTVDMRERDMADPAEIDQVAIVAFYISQQEMLDAIATNDLQQSDIRDYRIFSNSEGVGAALFSEFTIFGNDFDPSSEFMAPTDDSVWTWALLLITLDEGKQDIRSMMFIEPTPGESATEVAFSNTTAALDFQADLHSGEALKTLSDLDAYTLDWSGVTEDCNGHELDSSTADSLLLGHTSTTDITELENSFVQLLDVADELYRLYVYGETDANLFDAQDEEGNSFSGFTQDGTWVVGLECSSCLSPAPLTLTVVDVR